MRIDKFEVGEPQGVVHRGHTVEVVHVARGHDAVGANDIGHTASELGYGLLVVVAVAPHVVQHEATHIALEGFPFSLRLRPSIWGSRKQTHHEPPLRHGRAKQVAYKAAKTVHKAVRERKKAVSHIFHI